MTISSPDGLGYFDELRFYLNESMLESAVEIEQVGESYSFDYVLDTNDLDVGSYEFEVEMYSVGGQVVRDFIEFAVLEESSLINFSVISPSDGNTYNIGERIEVQVHIEGTLNLFSNFVATVYDPIDPIIVYETGMAAEYISFSFQTQDLNERDYELRLKLTNNEGISHTKTVLFTLVEYIPTWEVVDNAGTGYKLKSMIQTFDDGYIALSSDDTKGTRVVKYDKEGVLIWDEDIPS